MPRAGSNPSDITFSNVQITPMPALTLRPTIIGGDLLKNDYSVFHEGRPVGRISLEERASQGEVWEWHVSPPLPIPPWCNGAQLSFEAAKVAFREAWERFYASLTPDDIAHWHRAEDLASASRPWVK
jgi:hypothetical protein